MSYATGDPLAVRIRIAFGASIAANPATWTWTDVTSWWHVPDDVTITWGRSSGAEQAERSTLSLSLKNTDGRFTAYDPRSPYWPNVRKWTPISVDIDLGDGVGWRNRFSGFIRRWPLTWPGASPLMALARIEAVGVLGRLARGKPPVRSPLRRAIEGTSPVAYWPGEDGEQAGQAGSATSDVPALAVTGVVVFQPVADYLAFSGVTRYGTVALANLAGGGTLTATLPQAAIDATAGGPWTVHATALVDATTLSGDMVVLQWSTAGGTYVQWQLKVTTTSRTQVVGFTGDGTATTLIDFGSASAGFDHYAVSASVSGGTVTVTLQQGFNPSTPSTTFAGTLGGVRMVRVNPTGVTSTGDMPAGHIAVWATSSMPISRQAFVDSYGTVVREARRSWQSEAAVDRLARLCAEDGIPFTAPAVPADAVVRMGWQQANTSLVLYQESEDADGGLLYETGFGIGYLPRSSRYNASVALTIDGAARQLDGDFEPVDDDQALRNKWTVERIEGSSVVAADQESIDLQGEIEGSARLNLVDDARLGDQAGWRRHVSTVAEPRYPAIGLKVSAHRELAAAWCACRPGSRVQVVNPPEQNVPGVVDQLVMGATETFRGRRSWRVTINAVPASPWDVATADGPQRAPAEGTTLTAGITAAALSVQITSTARNGRWTTDPAAFPLAMRIGGERVTATGITGTGLIQTVTLSARAVNGVSRAWPAGTEVDVWQPAVAPL